MALDFGAGHMIEEHIGLMGRKALRMVALAVSAAAAVPASAMAAADEEDRVLESAFIEGLGGGAVDAPRLLVRRAGTSLELSARGVDGTDIGLTCLLCTAAEREARARRLGAVLSGRDEAAEISVSLERHRQGEDLGRRPPRRTLVLGGSGLALVAAGAVLLAFDGGCADSRRDMEGNCASLHRVAHAGWVMVGTGSAAVLAAVISWLADRTGDAGQIDEAVQ